MKRAGRTLSPEAARRHYLAAGERLVLETRRHIVILVRPLAAAVVGVIGASIIGYVVTPDSGGSLIDAVLGIAALALVARVGWRLALWWMDRIEVTDQRLVEISGVLTRNVASMPLEKVTDMVYRRTIGGRILGYGDLVFESAGQDQGLNRIDRVPDPDHFYRTVTGLVTGAAPERKVPEDFDPDDEDTGPLPRVIV
ncbi:MAG: PH domain-containing protein [Actinomycetota bacterium]